jgi:hypothetical protein
MRCCRSTRLASRRPPACRLAPEGHEAARKATERPAGTEHAGLSKKTRSRYAGKPDVLLSLELFDARVEELRRKAGITDASSFNEED